MSNNGDQKVGVVLGEAVSGEGAWYLPVGITDACFEEAEPQEFMEVLTLALHHVEHHFLREYLRRRQEASE